MTIAQDPHSRKFKAITIHAWYNGKPILKRIAGYHHCQTLISLYENLKRGITALEISIWAYRLDGYIYDLHHAYGLEIDTRIEPHDIGQQARYFLLTPIEILEVE